MSLRFIHQLHPPLVRKLGNCDHQTIEILLFAQLPQVGPAPKYLKASKKPPPEAPMLVQEADNLELRDSFAPAYLDKIDQVGSIGSSAID